MSISLRPAAVSLHAPSSRDWILVVGVALLASLPLLVYGAPFVGDLLHHYRTVWAFYDSILNGNFYPSWHPGTNDGYGDVSVRFYPPGIYYILCIARLLTRDWFFASLLSGILLTTLGSVGMYYWARSFVSHYYALAAGLLFMLAPFHANELYQAGMYGQYAAVNVLPFAFAFADRIIHGGRARNVAGLSASYGLIILLNVPVAVLGSMAIALYSLVRLFQSFKLTALYQLVTGALLGATLSCFYWLPVLRELKWKFPSGAGQGEWYNYNNNFLFQTSPSIMANYILPLLASATLAMSIPATILLLKKDKKALAPALVALFGFFMSTRLSKPVWQLSAALQETQFPWRWMTITSLCLSLLVTLSLPELYSLRLTRWRPLSLALIGLVLIALSFTILQLIRGASLFHRVDFNAKVQLEKGTPTNTDFLPVWARGKARSMKTEVEVPQRTVTVNDWSPERKAFTIESGPETEARLKLYYYPYWLAQANGQQLATRPADDGALLVRVPKDRSEVVVKFTEPKSSFISGVVSACALLVIIVLWIFGGRFRSKPMPEEADSYATASFAS